MNGQWNKAVRAVYADIDAAETGLPTPEALRGLHEAGEPQLMRVVAVLSVCRVIVYPQLPSDAIAMAAGALRDLQERLEGRSGPMPTVEELRRHETTEAGDCQQDALRCLGRAVDYLVSPSAQGFAALVGVMIAAQRWDPRQPRATREQMIAWMDDVVDRARDVELVEALGLAARAINEALPGLVEPFYFEGVGRDGGDLLVHVANSRTRRLIRPVICVAEPVLAERELKVRVKAEPNGASDRFRIGYLFEHFIHRMFLGSMWAMGYDAIAYESEASGDRWTVPA
jgi:hypothetical protein